MKIIPILFSTPMVQGILEDRKTITRRIIKPQPIDNIEIDGNFYEGNLKGYVKVDRHPVWKDQFVYEFSKYSVGDVLWVRETWKPKCFAGFQLDGYDYKADHVTWLEKNGQKFIKGSGCEQGEVWKPSLFMPKAACRLFLEVTDVRPERLHDISEQDAIKEGIEVITEGEAYKDYTGKVDWFGCPENSFRSLWEKINGEESWTKNPWVWVVAFKRIEKPTNFLTTIETKQLPHLQNNLPFLPIPGAG